MFSSRVVENIKLMSINYFIFKSNQFYCRQCKMIKLTGPRERKGVKNAPQTYTRSWTVLSSMIDESRRLNPFRNIMPYVRWHTKRITFFNPDIPPSDKFITLFNSENKNISYNLGLYISRALQCRKDLLTKVMWSINLIWFDFWFIFVIIQYIT